MGKTKRPKGKGTKPKPAGRKSDKAETVRVGGTELGIEILTLEEAADLLRVSVDGLKADAEKGTVPARNVGGEWRFVKHALLSWLAYPDPKRFHASDLKPPVGTQHMVKSMTGGGQKMVDLPYSDETLEEQEAYRRRMREIREEWGTVGGEDAE